MAYRIIKYGILLLTIFGFNCCNSNGQKNNSTMQTVKNVDIERYMGTWYEIARFPHSFEKGLVGVTATYSLKKNGKIQVVNQGYKDSFNGKHSKAKAVAKIPNSNEPGKLKVYFFFLFGADYYILELDEKEYQYAMVGSSSMNYLWILSRTPQMDAVTYNMLLEKARDRGYKVENLILVEQE